MNPDKDIKELFAIPECLKERVGFFSYYLLKILSESEGGQKILGDIYQFIPSFDSNCALLIFKGLSAIEFLPPFSKDVGLNRDTCIKITEKGKELLIKLSLTKDSLKEQFDDFLSKEFPEYKSQQDAIFSEIIKSYDNKALKELRLPVSDATFSENVQKIKQRLEKKYNELHSALTSRSFLNHLYANIFLAEGFQDMLGQINKLNIFMDTDAIVSSVIDHDHWHFSTISILNSIARLKEVCKDSNVSINIYITNKVMEDFVSLMRTVGNIINRILYGQGGRLRSEDSSKIFSYSPLRDFFEDNWETLHSYQTDIYTRINNLISVYDIKFFHEEDEKNIVNNFITEINTLSQSLINDEERKVNQPLSSGRKKVLSTDAYLVYLMRKATDTNKHFWLWTYHRGLMSAEKMAFDNVRNVIHNLFLLGALQVMELLSIKDQGNGQFIDRIKPYVDEYYNILFSKGKIIQENIDKLHKSIINYLQYTYDRPLEAQNKLNLIAGFQTLEESEKFLQEDFEYLESVLKSWEKFYAF